MKTKKVLIVDDSDDFRAMLKGYAITPDELADIGFDFARSINRTTEDIEHDARSAYRVALDHFTVAKAEQFNRLTGPDPFLKKWGTRKYRVGN